MTQMIKDLLRVVQFILRRRFGVKVADMVLGLLARALADKVTQRKKAARDLDFKAASPPEKGVKQDTSDDLHATAYFADAFLHVRIAKKHR
jgi:hypothetical protein